MLLFLAYIIGLWFTLRTHAAVIWTTEAEEKKMAHGHESALLDRARNAPPGLQMAADGTPDYSKNSIRESQMYKKILGKSLKQVGLSNSPTDGSWEQLGSSTATNQGVTPHLVPPKSRSGAEGLHEPRSPGLTEDNQRFVRHVTEVAATAAATAAHDAAKFSKKSGPKPPGLVRHTSKTQIPEETEESGLGPDPAHAGSSGGHDAPNWSKLKSSVILLSATLLYAVIAEMLVNTVDVVLNNVDIEEKFVGITLFALVPNTTEFLVRPCLIPHAISV